MTTANAEFATVNDPSNTCMFRLYTKLGLDRPGPANGVLHINDSLVRIDRKVATKAYGASFYTTSRSCVPDALRRVWDDAAFVLLDRSKAAVGLLVGRIGTQVALRYFQSRLIAFEIFHDPEAVERARRHHYVQLPIAIKEFDICDGQQRLKRIWFCTYHPEYYRRLNSNNLESSPQLHTMAFRERLIDMAHVLAYGSSPPQPAYLSCPLYYLTSFQVSIVMSIRVLETLDAVTSE
jgi:hypothetical protein